MRTLLLIFLASSLTIFSCSNQQDLKLPCGDFELGKLDNNEVDPKIRTSDKVVTLNTCQNHETNQTSI